MTEAEGTDTRPDYLLPKFKTVEDQARAYVEAQKLLGQRQAPPEIAPLGGTPEPLDAEGKTAVARKIAAIESGLAKLAAGDPAGAQELIAQGVNPRAAHMGLGIQQDVQREYRTLVAEPAGGPEGMAALEEWMNESSEVKAFQRDSYNAAKNSGDIQRATDAVRYMTDMHKQSTGYTPRQLTINVPGGAPKRVAGYRTAMEAGQATADPRYDSGKPEDAAYAAEVDARLGVSECLELGFVSDVPNRP